MKYVKMLGLLAVAAAALMAFAGSASATSLTSSSGTTPAIHATSVGHATLHNAVGTISCNSTVTGTVESHGPNVTVKGNISTLSFTGCTNGSVHVLNAQGHVEKAGSLEVHADPNGATKDGILTSSDARIGVTMFGIECGYSTKNTPIGTLDGGTDAKLTISASIPRTFGSAFCGATGNWTGTYTVNSPHVLEVH